MLTRPLLAPLVMVLVVALSGAASAAAFESAFPDAQGDPAYDDGRAAGPDYAHVDIVKVETKEVEGIVTVQLHFAAPPQGSTTYWLTIDLEGDGAADLTSQSNGGGSFRGELLYWHSYPRTDGNVLSFPLASDSIDQNVLKSAPKWNVQTGAVATGMGFNLVTDKAEGGNSGGGRNSPGVGAAAVGLGLLAAAGALALARRG